ncbi:hypothetical protein D770_05320 [Flammeovirgaceae bacterium 311]|nr:hypothetical protein D770_05320 [Flammeovirgaceae bacterium 311]
MPVNIYNEVSDEKIALLGRDLWDLPSQIHELEIWLLDRGKALPKGSYVADIGFDIRKDANGGGGVITAKMMRIMVKIGMDVYLSEYPTMNDKQRE